MHVHDFLHQVKKATRELTDKKGKIPSDEELSEHLGTPVVKIQVIFSSRSFMCPGRDRLRVETMMRSGIISI